MREKSSTCASHALDPQSPSGRGLGREHEPGAARRMRSPARAGSAQAAAAAALDDDHAAAAEDLRRISGASPHDVAALAALGAANAACGERAAARRCLEAAAGALPSGVPALAWGSLPAAGGGVRPAHAFFTVAHACSISDSLRWWPEEAAWRCS